MNASLASPRSHPPRVANEDRIAKQMNAKIVYDLETDPMRTSVNVFFCSVLCLLPASAQEGQDRSNTLDRDLAERNPYTSSADEAIGRQYS